MRFTLNSTDFTIDEFADGWAWSTDEHESDAFKTALEAQADAIRFMEEREAEEAERLLYGAEIGKYGDYKQQHWKRDW